jgi:subtilisin-like proprotein convertase family protein
MSSKVVLSLPLSYSILPTTVQLKVDKLENLGDTTAKDITLQLWFTTTPWNPDGPNSGFEVASAPVYGSASGTLAPHASIDDVFVSGAFKRPPPGTYFVTMVVAEATGSSNVNNGYVVDDYSRFMEDYIVVASNGALSLMPIVAPSISVETQWVVEKDSGVQKMEFTLKMAEAAPFAVTVRVDTKDQTAFDGVDYTGVHQTVTFAPGATSATVSVPYFSNLELEPFRAFSLNLSESNFATIASYYVDPVSGFAYPMPSAYGIIMDDDWSLEYGYPSDRVMGLQWYLYTTRAELTWPKATGKGIKIGIFDQGIDASNPDLAPNIALALGRNAADNTPGGAPVRIGDNHGTQVAGVIAAVRDDEGIVGVAYNAKLVSIYSSLQYGPQYISEITNAFQYAKTLDVLNNSWGFGNLLSSGTNWAFLDNANSAEFAPAFKALKELAAEGRKGLGTIVVQSAGNGYDYGDDTNLHNFQNSRYIITVGATDIRGASSYFSTTGASILVSAPGGAGDADYASIVTTDRASGAGSASGNVAFVDGTSFASPIVAGIVAMMLEVNPTLGFRDVQKILAYTAHHSDFYAGQDYWATNGAKDWNGGGMQYDNVVQATGFGLVDALAAVRLAAAWNSTPQTFANTQTATASKTVNLAIPDNLVAGLSSVINVTAPLSVERVDVTVNILHSFIGDLQITLTSPSGTKSYLMYRPSQGSLSAVGSSQKDIHFTFDTVLNWGESASGQWKLNVRDMKGGDVGTLVDWSIELTGSAQSKDKVFVYTYEYPDLVKLDPSRGILSAPGGENSTINAGALGLDNKIDLSGLSLSMLNGGTLQIAAGTIIRNAVGTSHRASR